jgi:hypothetical protein
MLKNEIEIEKKNINKKKTKNVKKNYFLSE